MAKFLVDDCHFSYITKLKKIYTHTHTHHTYDDDDYYYYYYWWVLKNLKSIQFQRHTSIGYIIV
jgi:hypothetical protein